MPSFDVVSTVDMHEVSNAVDQTSREIGTRYDFRGSKSAVELKENLIEIRADDDMKLRAIQEILKQKMAKREVSQKSLEFKDPQTVGGDMKRQEVHLKTALTTDELRRLHKIVKDMKVKVTAAMQGDQLRVTGKKRDILQSVISHLEEQAADLELQFENFRD